MESVSWMKDYLPVRMLAMAQRAECRFGDCLLACPRTDEGVIRIDDPEVFTRLLEARIESLLLSLAALESYLGYYAYETAKIIEDQQPGVTLSEYLEKHGLLDHLKGQPNRLKRRHELIMEENAKKPVARFLTVAPLSLTEKLRYWPLLRAHEMINQKDGYVKKIYKIISLREELIHPALTLAPEEGKISSIKEMEKVFLHHELPPHLTPGKSCSDEYVNESYVEEHFLWELLHVYPARAVPELIQYLHRMDGSENHFITAIRAAYLVDESGRPLTEPMKKFAIEVDLGE